MGKNRMGSIFYLMAGTAIAFSLLAGCARIQKNVLNPALGSPERVEKTMQVAENSLGGKWHDLRVGTHLIRVEIARSPEERTKGLSGHEPLAEDEGMLFVFQEPGVYSFWMKEMLFPLDMIWIRDGVVVDLSEHVPLMENGSITTRSPRKPVDMVLEVNAGWAQRNNISYGDPVDTPLSL